MEKFIKVIDYKLPIDLLGKSMMISLVSETEKSFWFKVMEIGTTEIGAMFISGFDDERMNRTIYLDDIRHVSL